MNARIEEDVKSVIQLQREKTINSIQDIELDRIVDRIYRAIELGYDDPETLINSHLYSYLEQSVRYRRGKLYEEIALIVSEGERDQESRRRRSDLILERNGERFALDLKVSPPRKRYLHQVRTKDYLGDDDLIPLIGFVYEGSEEFQEDPHEEQDVLVLSGKELWEFLSEDPDFYYKLFDWMGKSDEPDKKDLTDVLLAKRRQLLQDWGNKYGQASVYEVFKEEI